MLRLGAAGGEEGGPRPRKGSHLHASGGAVKFSEKLNTVVNIVVIIALGVFLVGPQGILYTRVKEWRKSAQLRERIARDWNALTDGGVRVDTGRSKPVLVEFSDYQCPFCRQANRVIEQWLATHDAGVIYRHFPLTAIHPAAEGAARAAICAEAQGRFRTMHLRLFETDTWQKDSNWVREAEAAGVPDLERFEACLTSDGTTRRLEADMALGRSLGVTGTPTFVYSQGMRSGVLSDAILSEVTHSGQ